MGLRDLIPDDAGDNRGGRPPEGNQDGKEPYGDPFIPTKDTKEWWRKIWNKFVSGEKPTPEEISMMADHTHLFPWDLKMHIEKHGIFRFDWEHMPEDYPSDSALADWLEEEGVESNFIEEVKAQREGYSKDSGLFSLVENAKEETRED